MLALAYQIKVDSKNNSQFADITRTHWAKDYIESLADIGIIGGWMLNILHLTNW